MKVKSCSLDCSSTPCPEGAVCIWSEMTVFGEGGSVLEGTRVCVPPCAVEDDCLESTRAGRCAVARGGEEATCFPSGCWPGESECPAGYECVDVELGDPSSPGWCQAP